MGACPRRGSRPRRQGNCVNWCRHRAKLVGLRSRCKAEVHAVLAKCGVQVLMSDLFGVWGTELLDQLDLPARTRHGSRHCAGLLDDVDFEITVFTGIIGGGWPRSRGTPRCRRSPGLAPPWVRSWSPRSATSPGSPQRRS